MYQGLISAHSGLRYFALLFLLLIITQSIRGWMSKNNYTPKYKLISSINLGFLFTQLIIGFALFAMSSKVVFEGYMMKSSLLRFFTMEHPLLMVIAISLVAYGHYSTKQRESFRSHRKQFWINLSALIIIIASIPWPFREALGAGWF